MMKLLINYSNPLKWVSFVLAGVLFVIRFLYGRNNELNSKGELELSTTGILLAIGAVFFFILGLGFGLLQSLKKKT